MLLLAMLCLALGTMAQTPEAQQGSSRVQESPPAEPRAPRPVFEFHSSFWVNLHHFLYEQARIEGREPTGRVGAETFAKEISSGVASAGGPDESSPDWRAAVAYYSQKMKGRDLLFDAGMVLINNRLAEMENCPDLSGRSVVACDSGLSPQMILALERAAPIYRARWWPEHNRTNRDWIAVVTPLVRTLGGTLAEQLAAIYHSGWQREPIHVDVVSYGGPFGAYTSLEPTHITVSSTDQGNQGLAGFEILFHEASHALAGAVQDAIARECRARDIPIPRDLWHALLFYTTGVFVKRALESAPQGANVTYTPYAVQNRLYARGWQNYLRVLESDWQPYLDGKRSFQGAIASMAGHL